MLAEELGLIPSDTAHDDKGPRMKLCPAASGTVCLDTSQSAPRPHGTLRGRQADAEGPMCLPCCLKRTPVSPGTPEARVAHVYRS